MFRDGVLQIGTREAIFRPDLAGCFDMLGFSYYSAHGVRKGQLVAYPEAEKNSPLGYAIWPNGLALVLTQLNQELPNTPLFVAEYGVGTSDDHEWLLGYDLQFGIINADRTTKPSS